MKQAMITRFHLERRAMWLFDVENFTGGVTSSTASLERAARTVEALGGYRSGDHMIVSTSKSLSKRAAFVFPNVRFLIGEGIDGADRALIEAASDIDWVASRYGSLVIASGDGGFTPLVTSAAAAGIPTTVIAVRGKLSNRLRVAASNYIEFTWPQAAQVASAS